MAKKTAPKNQLYYGDNLEVLRKYIKDESIDLCYIDPPFNSKRNYNQIYNNIGKEDKAQAQAFIDTWTWDTEAVKGYNEIISNHGGVFTKQAIELIVGLKKVLGTSDLMAYLISMTLRIAEIYRSLKPTGSFYLHCDPTASHYLKIVLDSIFCAKGGDFKNEIIWHYSGWNKKLPSHFERRHDVIFFYSKTESPKFNSFSEPWKSKEEYVKIRKQKVLTDDKGKEYVLSDAGNGNRVKRYLSEAMEYGKPVSNVWIIDKINNSSKEKLGYPTQKPEALLERIIKASTNEGDIVLDAYCGCGTSVAVSERLKRRWIGIDITYQSISLILKRLEKQDVESLNSITISGVPEDFESAVALAEKKDDRTRKEFEKWAVLTYSNNRAIINEKKGGDEGIDGIAYLLDSPTKERASQEVKEIIFSVKSNKSLSPTVVRDLNGTLDREGAVMGILITLYPMPNLVKESKKYGTYENLLFEHTYQKIDVISIQELLDGNRLNVPIALDVINEAQQKGKNNQITLGFD